MAMKLIYYFAGLLELTATGLFIYWSFDAFPMGAVGLLSIYITSAIFTTTMGIIFVVKANFEEE